MKTVLFNALWLLIVVTVIVVIAMAWSRGRDSRYFHLLSAVVAPVSTQLAAASPPDVVRPFSWAPGTDLSAWHWFQGEQVEFSVGADAVRFVPLVESVWWKNERGPMLYTVVSGDVTVTTRVQVRKQSNPSLPPDMEWQFAGVMLRDPAGDAWLSRENYVFNVVGHRGKRLQVETKSTQSGHSQVDAWDWESGDAELRIVRKGALFSLFARQGANAEWIALTQYERPDLPATLQVGFIVYAYSEGRGRFDMQGEFRTLEIQ